MKVRDVMTSPAVVVGADATYGEIVRTLRAFGFASVPVVDQERQLLGIVGEVDLAYREAYGHDAVGIIRPAGEVIEGQKARWTTKIDGRTAESLMDADRTCAGLDEELDVLARRLLRRRRSSMPVVHDGRVVGVVALRDVLRRFDRSCRYLQRDVEGVLTSWAYEHGDLATMAFELDNGVVRLQRPFGGNDELDELVARLLDLEGVIDVEVGEREAVDVAR